MKKTIICIMIFITVFNFLFAKEKEKHLYFKGEAEGVEVKVKLLDKYDLSEVYEVFESREAFGNYLVFDCNYNMIVAKHAAIMCTNTFPVEINNKSNKAIKCSSDDFLIIHMPFNFNQKETLLSSNYPDVINPNSTINFFINPNYSEEQYFKELYNNNVDPGYLNWLVNSTASEYDYYAYSVYKKFSSYGKIDLQLDKVDTFYAEYYFMRENVSVVLYLAYE